MSLKSKLTGPFRPSVQAAAPDLDARLESLAARLEQHTVNLADHQGQLRDEGLRAIVNEMRSNTSFLADSVVALERAQARRVDSAHAAVRPFVHEIRGSIAVGGLSVLVEQVDPILVDELVTHRHQVTVVEPSMDSPYPDGVVVAMTSIEQWRGPSHPVELVVWVARNAPSPERFDCVRSWMRDGASLIFGGNAAPESRAGFSLARARWFVRDEARYRLVESGAEGDLFVGHLRAV